MTPKWPEVELPETDFQQMLNLVEALDLQQLQRLYCKVAGKVPTSETLGKSPERDTIPPPPLGGVVSEPPPQATPKEYVDLDISWDDEDEGTNPGVGFT